MAGKAYLHKAQGRENNYIGLGSDKDGGAWRGDGGVHQSRGRPDRLVKKKEKMGLQIGGPDVRCRYYEKNMILLCVCIACRLDIFIAMSL